jgi:hypothetical protein
MQRCVGKRGFDERKILEEGDWTTGIDDNIDTRIQQGKRHASQRKINDATHTTMSTVRYPKEGRKYRNLTSFQWSSLPRRKVLPVQTASSREGP